MADTTVRRVHRLHELLLGRGWQVDNPRPGELDDAGRPRDVDTDWYYPASYGGVIPRRIEDLSPEPAVCLFSLDGDNEPDHITVVTAGVYYGCAEHRKTERYLDLDDEPGLHAALEHAEHHAAAVDARVLIECRFFGACGDH